MDADKLNDAAENHFMTAIPYFHCSDTVRSIADKAFKAGASWLMQQPLSDRLTEAEKERIKAKYNELKSLNSITNDMFADDAAILEWLFGKDLFNEK